MWQFYSLEHFPGFKGAKQRLPCSSGEGCIPGTTDQGGMYSALHDPTLKQVKPPEYHKINQETLKSPSCICIVWKQDWNIHSLQRIFYVSSQYPRTGFGFCFSEERPKQFCPLDTALIPHTMMHTNYLSAWFRVQHRQEIRFPVELILTVYLTLVQYYLAVILANDASLIGCG